MRRRPVGIGAVQKDKQRLELFQLKGTLLAKQELDKLTSQMKDFKDNLEKFASQYKKDIRKNEQLRKHFQQMCAAIGVDPLKSSSSYWAKLLDVGDFYYQLAIQINEVFITTNAKNGGILTLDELTKLVCASRNDDKVTPDDVLQGIRKLTVLGGGIRVIPSKDTYIVHATPAELNSDQLDVIQLVHENKGNVSATQVTNKFNWSADRTEKALEELIMEGLIWMDHQNLGEPLYWLPNLK